MADTRQMGRKFWNTLVTLLTIPCPFGLVDLGSLPMKSLCWLQCFTRIKFMVLSDPRQAGIDTLLRKIYELYSDYALKNPFYSLEMPIRSELFDQNLRSTLEVAEKAGTFGPSS
ncbi:trafficking protein particle complex subunit 4 S homeolog isoform X1 [Xenopus laevis]|uniref:Trafficking protein particle complex subunit n=1 Tax=Xenopus laevis TaxID=8355 RepID=A0A8J0U6D4_XENLA|nr:trafficking protein particle complex subunit 4 S homeolog isoform X1 [Xenopus laevis]